MYYVRYKKKVILESSVCIKYKSVFSLQVLNQSKASNI